MHGKCSSNNKKTQQLCQQEKAQIDTIIELQKDDCPMNGNCLINNVIYKCTVSPATTTTKQRAYIGLSDGECKQWYYSHTQSFRNAKHKNEYSTF